MFLGELYTKSMHHYRCHHNKPDPCTSSGIASTEPLLGKPGYDGYNRTIIVWWTLSRDEVRPDCCIQRINLLVFLLFCLVWFAPPERTAIPHSFLCSYNCIRNKILVITRLAIFQLFCSACCCLVVICHNCGVNPVSLRTRDVSRMCFLLFG